MQESALAGGSQLVDKVAHALGTAGLPLGDRRNLAYMGTAVTYGRGQIVVPATGKGCRVNLHLAAAVVWQYETTKR